MTEYKTSFYFAVFLLLKALLMLWIIEHAGIGLGPDEAQYWTWSQHLDAGYYSKPPGIAWQIALGTFLFGSTELGVRFASIILGSLLSWAIYRLAINARLSPEVAFLSGLLSALTPFGFFGTFLAITDGGMLLFWTFAFLVFIRGLRENKPPSYVKIGLLVACGALFKWPIYLIWIVFAIQILLRPSLFNKNFFLGIALSLLGLFPTLYWNYTHDFATFKHVTTIVQGGNDGGSRGNPLEFLASQAAIVSPLVFLLMLYAWVKIVKQKQPLLFLGASSLGILFAFTLYACFKKGQGNWCLFVYPMAFVYTASVLSSPLGKKLLIGSLAIGCLLTAGVFFIPEAQKENAVSIPWKINPFRHNLGWENFEKIPMDPKKQFLIADKYQIVSELSFYSAHQQQAYFFNLLGTRKNQFSYWGGLEKEKGKEGIFVAVEMEPHLEEKMERLKEFYEKALTPYFETVGKSEIYPLFKANGKIVKSALVIKAQGFKGKIPKDPEKY